MGSEMCIRDRFSTMDKLLFQPEEEVSNDYGEDEYEYDGQM